MTKHLLVLCLCAPLLACAKQKEPNTPGEELIRLERLTIAGYSNEELLREFERARSLLLVDEFAKAAKAFERLMRLTTNDRLAALAMFNSGLAHEGLGNRATALRRYHKVKNDFASHPIARNALLRCSRLLGRSEQWDELTDVATELLKRKDLAAMDRIEGYGALALAHVQRGRLKEAAAAIMRANAAIEKAGLGQTLKPPVQFAQVAFAEGELLRLTTETAGTAAEFARLP